VMNDGGGRIMTIMTEGLVEYSQAGSWMAMDDGRWTRSDGAMWLVVGGWWFLRT
jgi:hypothetical protein